MPRSIISVILFLLILAACDKEQLSDNYKPKFAVEGWIEAGDFPYVILTHNSPFFTSLDSARMDELVIRWAKVTVSDGENTEVLSVVNDKNAFPPIFYKGSRIKGEPGKHYQLTIEYAGDTLHATTQVPEPVYLQKVWFEHRKDSLYQLNLAFNDLPGQKNYYRICTRLAAARRYIPALFGNLDDRYFEGQEYSMQVNQGPESNLTVRHEPYFKQGDAVRVKFSNMPVEAYNFWSSFQDEVLGSSNPLFGTTNSLKGNISGDAVGIWSGYGSVVYQLIAGPPASAERNEPHQE